VVVDGAEVVGVGAAVVAEVAAGDASVQAASSGGGLRHCSQAKTKVGHFPRDLVRALHWLWVTLTIHINVFYLDSSRWLEAKSSFDVSH
jgi:hypothetical protein